MIGRRLAVAVWLGLLVLAACEPVDPALQPDAQLIELGLSERDRVHTVALSTEDTERATPDSIVVLVGDYLQFVSDDWLVHEVQFDSASLTQEGWSFLDTSGQLASPPLLQRGSRFVLSFVDAPPGRYPVHLEGNRGSGTGVIIVAPPSGMP